VGAADDGDAAPVGFHAGDDIGTAVPLLAVDPDEPKVVGGAAWFHQACSLRLAGAPGGLRTSCSVVHWVPYLLPD